MSEAARSAAADFNFELLNDHLEYLTKKHGHFIWQGSFADVVTVVAQVQLALRHPDNPAGAAERARGWAEQTIDALDKGSPGIGAILRRGFDPAQDVPIRMNRR